VTFDGAAGKDRADLTAELTLGAGAKFDVKGGSEDDVLALTGAKLTVPAGAALSGTGDAGNDRFENGATPLVITHATGRTDTAGTGNDTAASTGTGAHTWSVGTNTVTLDNQLTLQSVESVQGGSGIDTFVFVTSSQLAGTLDGGGGLDVLNVSALSAVTVILD